MTTETVTLLGQGVAPASVVSNHSETLRYGVAITRTVLSKDGALRGGTVDQTSDGTEATEACVTTLLREGGVTTTAQLRVGCTRISVDCPLGTLTRNARPANVHV